MGGAPLIAGSAPVAEGAQPRCATHAPPVDNHVKPWAAAKRLMQGGIQVFVATLHDDTE